MQCIRRIVPGHDLQSIHVVDLDPFVGRLAFVRVYSGKLDAGSYVLDTRSGVLRP